MEEPLPISKYSKAEHDSARCVDEIIQSQALKKVVVAGPGTGKTFLFKEVLKGKGKALTLTFVNSLVEDLSLELCGISEVKTLHGFARSILSKVRKNDINIFPKFSKIIAGDALYLLEKEVNYDKIFHEKDDENENLNFYHKRREYYNYYGFSDIIYAAVSHFENNKDDIPIYEQVLIDEFQDFNILEVSLIDLLAEKNPILIVGDDDQALYGFKSASTDHIRKRHNNEISEYEPFNLPFCRRFTRIIVDAVADIIKNAQDIGLLKDRIKKPFIYFDHKEKDKESEKYPTIGYTKIYDAQISLFIAQKIGEMAKNLKCKFSVLVISPYRSQSQKLVNKLKEKGLDNIEYVDRGEPEINIIDGVRLLLENKKDNLGWRIMAELLMPLEDFLKILKKTEEEPGEKIFELVEKDFKKEVISILKVLKDLINNEPINDNDYVEVINKIGYDPAILSKEFLKNEINFTSQKIGNPSIRKIPIKATTIQSAKGLSGDLVFITHLDDKFFIKDSKNNAMGDVDICNFIVALTRTKKKAYLISTEKDPTLLKFISNEKIEYLDKPFAQNKYS